MIISSIFAPYVRDLENYDSEQYVVKQAVVSSFMRYPFFRMSRVA